MNPEKWPPLRDLIARYDLKARKSLGQNFLLDQNITDKIVRTIPDLAHYNCIEIGPGPGGLTRSLLQAGVKSLHAFELDQRAVSLLSEMAQSDPRLSVYHADALEADVVQGVPHPRIIVANLPYNIASPLLINWLKRIRADAHVFKSMTLMFQKEVAERICAAPGSRAYGRLSVMSQWLCRCEKLFDVPPSAFVPPPKVTSSIVRLTPKMPEDSQPSFEAMEAISAAAFGQRRKMIRSSLKRHAQALAALGLDTQKRAEDLTVNDFVAIARKNL